MDDRVGAIAHGIDGDLVHRPEVRRAAEAGRAIEIARIGLNEGRFRPAPVVHSRVSKVVEVGYGTVGRDGNNRAQAVGPCRRRGPEEDQRR